MVDLQFDCRLHHFVPLSLLKGLLTLNYDELQAAATTSPETNAVSEGITYLSEEELQYIKEMPLLSQGRLSVQPVSPVAFEAIQKLGERGGWDTLSLAAAKKNEVKPQRMAKPSAKRKAGKKDRAENEDLSDSDVDHPPKKSKSGGSRSEGAPPSRRSTRTKAK